MIQVTGTRGAGDSPGDDIIEPLLSTVPAALERARVELDIGTLQTPLRIEGVYQPTLINGDLVTIYDAVLGEVKTGTVTDIEHQATIGGAITTFTAIIPDE